MRVLFVTSHLGAGGAQTSLARLAGELAGRHEVHLYSLDIHPPDRGLEKRLRKAGVGVVRMPYLLSRGLQLANGLLSLGGQRMLVSEAAHRLRLRRLIRRLEPGVVNSHLFNADRVASAAVRDLDISLVVSDHGDYRYVVEEGVVSAADVERILGEADAIVYLSDDNRAVLSRFVPMDDIITRKILNGVSSRDRIREIKVRGRSRRIQRDEREFRYVMVARGIPEKGWFEFVKAMERLSGRTEKRVRGLCVGDGAFLRELEADVGASRRSPVEFIGYSEDPVEVIVNCDVGVLPSRFEGESLPMAVAEYLVCGKPVIATAVGGIPEMLEAEAGTAGVLLPAGSDGRVRMEDLLEAMASYLEDPELYAAHAQRAEQMALRFSTEACAEAYEALFDDVR